MRRQMKTIIIFSIIGLFLFSNLVSATHLINQTGGITPDNILWGLDVAIDKIMMLIQFTPEGKANQGLLIAQERLLEVREMLLKNDTISAQKAAAEHNATLQEVEISIKTVNELGQIIKIKIEIEQHNNDINEIEEEIKIKVENHLASIIIDGVDDESDDTEEEIKTHVEEVKIKIQIETGKTNIEIENEEKEIEREIKVGRR